MACSAQGADHQAGFSELYKDRRGFTSGIFMAFHLALIMHGFARHAPISNIHARDTQICKLSSHDSWQITSSMMASVGQHGDGAAVATSISRHRWRPDTRHTWLRNMTRKCPMMGYTLELDSFHWSLIGVSSYRSSNAPTDNRCLFMAWLLRLNKWHDHAFRQARASVHFIEGMLRADAEMPSSLISWCKADKARPHAYEIGLSHVRRW